MSKEFETLRSPPFKSAFVIANIKYFNLILFYSFLYFPLCDISIEYKKYFKKYWKN